MAYDGDSTVHYLSNVLRSVFTSLHLYSVHLALLSRHVNKGEKPEATYEMFKRAI